MNPASRLLIPLLTAVLLVGAGSKLAAEPLPLKRAVDLALTHGAMAGAATPDEQRAFASYREVRNQYVPQLAVGSGLGASWGFPLSLAGAAPSLVNVNAQSALINPALRDFVKAAKIEWQAAGIQGKDQRQQVIQTTVLSYVELCKWESMLTHAQLEETEASRMEKIVNERIQEGVDNPQARNKARLSTARARLGMAEVQGAIDVLRNRLSQLTGLPAASIETAPDSIPPLPVVKQEDDLVGKATQVSPAVEVADIRAQAQTFRARGEHRALWPSVDFAAQYALLAQYNNYDAYFKTFQRNNATVGVAIRFPFFNSSQHARAEGADIDALRAKQNAQATRNQVSDETLQLQRSVEQLAAAQQVADLEYQVAQSDLEAMQVRMDAGSATLHDVDDARRQAGERYTTLQSADFELERARISLLRSTGELETWLGTGK